MMKSRVTLAIMEAAAIERDFESPLMICLCGYGRLSLSLPSINNISGSMPRLATASSIAHMVALRIFISSMARLSIIPIPMEAL